MSASKTRQRLARVLALVPYLLANPGTSPDGVCRALDIDRQTLDADLELLWMCGVPPYDPFALIDVEHDGDQITVSKAEYFARPVSLTVDEALALKSALAVLGDKAVEGGALRSLLAKVEEALGERAACAPIEFAATMAPSQEIFATMETATRDHRRVRVTYYSASRDAVNERVIDPYRILGLEGHWYVLAHCHTADARRPFRVDRIESATVTDETFDECEELDTSSYEVGVLFTPSSSDRKARVRFSPGAARFAREVWADSQCDPAQDGSIEIQIAYSSPIWMIQQVLPFGPEAKIIEPPELVEAFTETISLLLDRYSDAPGPDTPAGVE